VVSDALERIHFHRLGTTIYGTLILVKTKNKINPARHLFHGYTPSGKNTMTLTPLTPAEQSQNNQDLKTEFSELRRNNSNTLGFDLSNTFEAKVTDKDSTKVEPKK
jgi:hypothetical protein